MLATRALGSSKRAVTSPGDEGRRATDPEFLSRVQFALTASFHFLYPPLSMGLGLMLVVIGVAYARTKDPKWRQLSFFWVKVYGLIFALGVATGIVQEFEFGMNWADYSRFVGNVFGSLLAAEGVFAFALEGGFLGLLLFGGNRLGPRLWLFATIVVVFGAHFSALWIIMANSWMQTPQGYTIATDPAPTRAVMTDFWQVVFTPSFMPRLLHVFMASWTVGRGADDERERLVPAQEAAPRPREGQHEGRRWRGSSCSRRRTSGSSGPSMAIEVTNEQPLKLASMEGLWESTSCAPLYLVGWVDEATQTTTGISIPCLLSVLAYFNPQATVQGINSCRRRTRPRRSTWCFRSTTSCSDWGRCSCRSACSPGCCTGGSSACSRPAGCSGSSSSRCSSSRPRSSPAGGPRRSGASHGSSTTSSRRRTASRRR